MLRSVRTNASLCATYFKKVELFSRFLPIQDDCSLARSLRTNAALCMHHFFSESGVLFPLFASSGLQVPLQDHFRKMNTRSSQK